MIPPTHRCLVFSLYIFLLNCDNFKKKCLLTDSMSYHSITFYKYFDFKDFEEKRFPLKDLMIKHDVKGKIIISSEGVNGAVCSLKKNVDSFLEELGEFIPQLEGVSYRDTISDKQCFKRTLVKIRDELVPLGVKEVTPNTLGGGNPLKPETLMNWYESGEDFVIIDARNDYEWEVGHFKGADNPNIEKFRDFKEYVKKLEDYKDKKVVTYCTGGIRCEKASAYMKQKGFKEIYKLDGGIIEFMKLEESEKYWNGKLFVFDKRWDISTDKVRSQNE